MNLQQDELRLIVSPGGAKAVTAEAVGTGDTVEDTFDSTLANTPIAKGSLVVTVAGGGAVATDDGAGGFTGAGIDAASTINYETGALHIVYSAAPAAQAITAAYNAHTPYVSKAPVIGVGDGVLVNFKSTLALVPVRPKSISIVTDSVTAIDNGKGVLSGTGVAAGSTINYRTGAIDITYTSAPVNLDTIVCTYDVVKVISNLSKPREVDTMGRALDSIRLSVPAETTPAAARVTVVVESSDTPADDNFIEDGRFATLPIGDAIKKFSPLGRYLRFTGYSYGAPQPFPISVTLLFRN